MLSQKGRGARSGVSASSSSVRGRPSLVLLELALDASPVLHIRPEVAASWARHGAVTLSFDGVECAEFAINSGRLYDTAILAAISLQ